jgi:hypothetical protein
MEFINPILYYKEEGKFSMYIDAVENKYGKSSYSNELESFPQSYSGIKDIFKAYSKWNSQ